MVKLNNERTKSIENKEVKVELHVYEAHGYIIEETVYDYRDGNAWTNIQITADLTINKYLPTIYVDKKFGEKNIKGFKIQTTSLFGALNLEEMEEFIEANKIAMIVVKELNEIFVEEI